MYLSEYSLYFPKSLVTSSFEGFWLRLGWPFNCSYNQFLLGFTQVPNLEWPVNSECYNSTVIENIPLLMANQHGNFGFRQPFFSIGLHYLKSLSFEYWLFKYEPCWHQNRINQNFGSMFDLIIYSVDFKLDIMKDGRSFESLSR